MTALLPAGWARPCGLAHAYGSGCRMNGTWRKPDEVKWVSEESGATTLRRNMPSGRLQCYGCGEIEPEAEERDSGDEMAVMLPFRHVETGEMFDVFLCEMDWSSVGLEDGHTLVSIWDWLPEPRTPAA